MMQYVVLPDIRTEVTALTQLYATAVRVSERRLYEQRIIEHMKKVQHAGHRVLVL
jgi:hypothetical protein